MNALKKKKVHSITFAVKTVFLKKYNLSISIV